MLRVVERTEDGRVVIDRIATREHDQLRAVAELVTDADVAGTHRVLGSMLDALEEIESGRDQATT